MGAISNHSSTFNKAVKRVFKSSDETVNNSAVLQNDNHLLFAVKALETWAIKLYLRFTSATATPAIKFGWALPAGATLSWGPLLEGNATSETELTAASTEGIATSSANKICVYEGVVSVGAAAGNVQFQWAQNTATVENTTVKANSYVIATQLG